MRTERNTYDSVAYVFGGIWLLYVLFMLALGGGIIYAAIHFIKKLW